MRTKNDIKILLCYLLKNLNGPISKSALELLFQTTLLANFFEVGDAVAALIDAGMIAVSSSENGEEMYSITEAGIFSADKLETDLPMSTRKQALNAALEIIAREKTMRYTDAVIQKLDRGYHVTLTIRDGDTVMMQTVLYAADSIQANYLCDRFTADPSKLYAGIVDLLTR